jgi:hypothetical protein
MTPSTNEIESLVKQLLATISTVEGANELTFTISPVLISVRREGEFPLTGGKWRFSLVHKRETLYVKINNPILKWYPPVKPTAKPINLDNFIKP